MSKLKRIIYEFRLKQVRSNLKKNAYEIREAVNKGLDYLANYNKQIRLMSCKSYLENKLSWIN